jgi:hypothetical protein
LAPQVMEDRDHSQRTDDGVTRDHPRLREHQRREEEQERGDDADRFAVDEPTETIGVGDAHARHEHDEGMRDGEALAEHAIEQRQCHVDGGRVSEEHPRRMEAGQDRPQLSVGEELVRRSHVGAHLVPIGRQSQDVELACDDRRRQRHREQRCDGSTAHLAAGALRRGRCHASPSVSAIRCAISR